MALKEGYMVTEVGVIPIDWTISRLKEIAQIETGFTPSTKDKKLYGGDFLFVSPADLGSEKWISESEKTLSQKGIAHVRKFPANSILFTCIGSTIGKCGMAKRELTSNQQINALFPNSTYDSNFLYYSLQSASTKIKALAGEQAVPIVNKSAFGDTRIPLPSSIKEQTAIANALSDVDALISSLEKLIEKKKRIKEGAMQQLLTGNKRLAGFTGDWQEKRLGEIGEFKNGVNKGKNDFGFGFPFVNLMDVFGRSFVSGFSHLGLINTHPLERSSYDLRKGDVLFVRSSVKPEGVGLTSVISEDLPDTVYSGFLIRFRSTGVLTNNYKKHCFFEKGFRKSVIEASTVSANTNINQEGLRKLMLKFPIDEKEQLAISQVLDDLDAEIECLNQKLLKHKKIKQGMMQNLLTGKIRLVKQKEREMEMA